MILTTITPYWKRPEQLRIWLECIKGAFNDNVHHLLYVVGDEPLPALPGNLEVVRCPPSNHSIAHYHNLGARDAQSEWIMKLDIDALPNVQYFNSLLPVLERAVRREWFNGGMIYVNQMISETRLRMGPLHWVNYVEIMANRQIVSASSYNLPAATNFICRRQDYLDLGGCPEAFKGYGWEDYAQIYILEHHQQGLCPLPGPVSLQNITQRCRDEISRPKAHELWQKDSALCLLHRWHPRRSDPSYVSHQNANRRVLFDYVLRQRAAPLARALVDNTVK